MVGGVDELVDHHVQTHRLIRHYKTEPITLAGLLESKTEGAVMAEGSHFFVLSNEKQESTYAELSGIEIYNKLSQKQLSGQIKSFLNAHNTTIADVDLIVLGNNGDVNFDGFYHALSQGLFKDTSQACFKHLSGEFDTASAFAFWMASKIIKTQSIPEVIKINNLAATPKTVLIYNQYRGENHSLVLLKKC